MEKTYAGMTIQSIVNKYSDTLIRIAFQNTRSLQESEDIVQETYFKLLKGNGTYTDEHHLKSWLIKVTYNKCKDYFRSAWFKRVIPLSEGMDFFAPEEQAVMVEIFQLKKEDRTIIYLYYYEGYSIREIGQILEKNENTISSKLQRARKKLKQFIVEGRAFDERSV